MKTSRLAALVLALAAGSAVAAGPAAPDPCVGSGPMLAITAPVGDEVASGIVARPSTDPTGIVVFFHGYGHTSESWRVHAERVSSESGVLAVALDYRGDERIPAEDGGLPSSRGWQVQEGAEDGIAIAQQLLASCPSAETVVAYGISMGGNASGLAVAEGATRPDGTPLFDWWFDVEGATNVTETYHEARAVALSGNEFAVNAVADIERQMGGTFAEVPEAYLQRTVVRRADDVVTSGVRGIVMVHGVDDGLVPHNQSREMAAALAGSGVPVEFTTVVRRDAESESGTTATGTVLGGAGWDSPFAGHASEASTTHLVNRIAFARLAEVLAGDEVACTDIVADAGSRVAVTRPGC